MPPIVREVHVRIDSSRSSRTKRRKDEKGQNHINALNILLKFYFYNWTDVENKKKLLFNLHLPDALEKYLLIAPL